VGASRGQLMQLDASCGVASGMAEKAERLAAARQPTDSDSFTIPAAPFYERVTNVQNLLARAFGQESVHYQNFVRFANRFTCSEAEFANCRAVFVAAVRTTKAAICSTSVAPPRRGLADALAAAKELLAVGSKSPPACWPSALQSPSRKLADEHSILMTGSRR